MAHELEVADEQQPLTLLSSATSRRAALFIAQRCEGRGDAHVLGLDVGKRARAAIPHVHDARKLEVPGERAEREAPNVLPFDFSECAARRNRSASPFASDSAQLGEHRRGLR
jgi:hypothetical protein